jgi:hypothetical protein
MVDLDRSIDSLKPGFYARYGDDLILADPNIEKSQEGDKIFKETLKKYQLKSKVEKEDSLFFNMAGRHPNHRAIKGSENGSKNGSDHANGQEPPIIFKGCDRLIFLGCDIMAKGTVSVSRKLEKEILGELSNRLEKTKQRVNPLSHTQSDCLTAYCKVINEALDPKNKLAHKSAGLLRHGINDRSCLKRLDFSIAQLLLTQIFNNNSIKNFRQITIKDMRGHGLLSLVNNRNQVGKNR